MEKKLEKDDELKEFLEELYIKEAEEMEAALFADEDFEDLEMTDEEVQASYEKLVARLKADGIYREDAADDKNSMPINSERPKSDKIIPMPVPAMQETEEDIRKKVSGDVVQPQRIGSGGGGGNRKVFKVAKVAGIVLVCTMCVFAASMTSEANRNYLVDKILLWSGNDTKMIVDNDERNEKAMVEEHEAIKDIETSLDIEMPEFYYRPQYFEFYDYEVNAYISKARMEYFYGENIITFYIDKLNDRSVSNISSTHGDRKEVLELQVGDLEISVEKTQNEQDKKPTYTAQWVRENVLYHLSGKMEEEEFLNLLKGIKFLE